MVREILLLGNPKLYQVSSPVEREEIGTLKGVVQDLHDTLLDFQQKYGAGRQLPHRKSASLTVDSYVYR